MSNQEGSTRNRNMCDRNLTFQPHRTRDRNRRTADNARTHGSFAMQYPVHRNNYNYYSVTPTRFFRVDHRYRNVQNRVQNVKRKPRKLPEKKYSRPPSPSVGNKEEDKLRRIRETSDMIKELMMSPKLNVSNPTSQDTSDEKEDASAEDVPVKPIAENNAKDKPENKRSAKSSSGNRNESKYSVEEIHDKIIKHISNLSYNKKMKLISSASAGYNIVFDQMAKQKQLELSKALRDMCSEPSPENTEQISSMMPDFDIKIEELPIAMIQVLSNTLGYDFENTCSMQSYPLSSLEKDKEVYGGSQGDEDDCIIIKNELNEYEDSFESNGVHLKQNVNAISDFEKSQDDSGIVQMKSQTANVTSLSDNSLVQNQIPYCSQIDPVGIKSEVNEPEDCFDINYYSDPEGRDINAISDFDKTKDDAGTVQTKSQTANTGSLLDNSVVEDQIPCCSQIDSVGIKSEVNEPEDCVDINNYDSYSEESFDEMAQESTTYEELDVNKNTENLPSGQSQNISYPLQLNGIENNKTTCTSTQTDCNIYQSHLTASIDPAKPRTLEESVSLMYDIDKEILRLTELRQSLFVNLSRTNKEVPVQSSPSNLQDVHLKRKPNRKEKKKAKRFKLTCNEKNVAAPTTPETPAFNFNYDIELLFEIDHEKILDVKVVDEELACVSESGQLFFVDTKDGKTLRKVKVTDNGRPATSVCILKPHIFVGGFDSTVKQYDLNTRLLVKSIPLDYEGLQVEITCLELCWNFIFIGTSDGVLLRYSLSKKKVAFADRISESSLLVLKGTQEGARRILIIGSRNAPVCIRDAMSGLHMRVMDNLLAPTVYSLLLNKHLVYCGTTSHDILVFNFHDGTLVRKYPVAGNKSIGCMKVVDKLLFASCHNGSIYIYNTELHRCVGCIKGPGGIILSMEVVGNMIIVGTMSRNFKSIIIPADILNSNK